MIKSFWETTSGKRVLFLLMIPLVVLLNYFAVKTAIFMKIPFFLDTWATALGVMVGGLAVGLVGGILYNLIMMTEWGASAWVWAFANISVALLVYTFWKLGWVNIRKPGKLLVSALIIGLIETVVVIVILFTAWGGVETYEGVLPTYTTLLDATGSKVIAAIGEKFITIPVDQIVSLFLAAIVASSISKKFILTKRKN